MMRDGSNDAVIIRNVLLGGPVNGKSYVGSKKLKTLKFAANMEIPAKCKILIGLSFEW